MDTYRVISFQHENVVETLMTDGFYQKEDWYDERTPKAMLYSNYIPLETEEEYILPLYTFFNFNRFHQYPLSCYDILDNWMEFNRWYRLYDRCILEMEIPANEGVLGIIEDTKVITLDTFKNEEWRVEFVVPYFKKEWVREIYDVSSEMVDSKNHMYISPRLKQNLDTLFKDIVHLIWHHGVRPVNAEEVIALNKPVVGKSYRYNRSILSRQDAIMLMQQGAQKYFPDFDLNNHTPEQSEAVADALDDYIYE